MLRLAQWNLQIFRRCFSQKWRKKGLKKFNWRFLKRFRDVLFLKKAVLAFCLFFTFSFFSVSFFKSFCGEFAKMEIAKEETYSRSLAHFCPLFSVPGFIKTERDQQVFFCFQLNFFFPSFVVSISIICFLFLLAFRLRDVLPLPIPIHIFGDKKHQLLDQLFWVFLFLRLLVVLNMLLFLPPLDKFILLEVWLVSFLNCFGFFPPFFLTLKFKNNWKNWIGKIKLEKRVILIELNLK